jgi:hypothetical protein
MTSSPTEYREVIDSSGDAWLMNGFRSERVSPPSPTPKTNLDEIPKGMEFQKSVEEESDDEDVCEVDEVVIEGETYYKAKDGTLYDPETSDEVGKLVDGKFELVPDWRGGDTNVASGWTRCKADWGKVYSIDYVNTGVYYKNWDDAIRCANEFGEDCGGITLTRRGYSLRKTRQSISDGGGSLKMDKHACWTKDYIHEGKKFNPTRNPAIPHTEGKNPKERQSISRTYDMESKHEFEVWKENGCV